MFAGESKMERDDKIEIEGVNAEIEGVDAFDAVSFYRVDGLMLVVSRP